MRRDSMISIGDQFSIPSNSIACEYKPDLIITEFSASDSMASSSVDTFETNSKSQSQSREPVGIVVTARAVSHTTTPVSQPYATDIADTV
jgi:hypothetical protein